MIFDYFDIGSKTDISWIQT